MDILRRMILVGVLPVPLIWGLECLPLVLLLNGMKPVCFSRLMSTRARAIHGLLVKHKVKELVLLGACKRNPGAAAEAAGTDSVHAFPT